MQCRSDHTPGTNLGLWSSASLARSWGITAEADWLELFYIGILGSRNMPIRTHSPGYRITYFNWHCRKGEGRARRNYRPEGQIFLT